jgi:signal transduction histidine kinase
LQDTGFAIDRQALGLGGIACRAFLLSVGRHGVWRQSIGKPGEQDGVRFGLEGWSGVISSVRLHQLLLAAVVVLPGLIFAAAAWQNQRDVLREGQDTIERTAAVMQEHARKVLETAELAIRVVDERIDDENWETISSSATSEFLRRLKAPMDQLVSIWVADRDGVVRAGSQPWPPGSGIGGRDFFQASRGGNQGTFIGAPFRGRATASDSFAIIRPRTLPSGGAGGDFDGTIHVAVSPSYFAHFYAEIAPRTQHSASLIRVDGALLARDPPLSGTVRISSETALMRRIAAEPNGGLVRDASSAGVDLEYAFRRVGSYPVYVVFSVPRDVLLKRWHRNLQVYGAVAAGAALTLLLVSWLALRRAHAEQVALSRLQAESRQRQDAELQLRHAQRLDAVGQLTGGVAHDFNNLLTAIMGNLELIQRAAAAPVGGGTGSGERITRLAATAVKAVQRGSALTKSLLAFSRKQPLQPRAIDANALLIDFLDLVRQAVGESIQVLFEPGEGLSPCYADPAELEAALLNLAINARDVMPDGGELLIRTDAVALSAEALAGNPEARPGRFVSIEVSDTGWGMSAEVAAKAFEPYFTTKPIGQGTGLGLSQVFGSVRQLGGHVTLTSMPDGGTSICLFLPVA